MIGLRSLGFAMAALSAAVGRAQACPITLEGDAEVVDRVRAELGDFQDGGACVAVWARCRRTGDQIEVDLHDELGRSSLHLFRSADGAAAFLISWSRRPLPDRVPGAPPGLVEPGPPRTSAAPAQLDRLWQPEIGLAYVASSGAHSPWVTATAAVAKHAGTWRYGGAGHILVGVNGPTVTAEVEAALGLQTALSPRITVVSELFVGDAVVARGSSFGDMDYGAGGLRAGIRAGIAWQFSAPFGIELQWGYDVVQWSSSSATPAGSDGTSDVMRVWGLAAPNHVALGLRWLP